MNEKQAQIIGILVTITFSVMLFYFFMVFPYLNRGVKKPGALENPDEISSKNKSNPRENQTKSPVKKDRSFSQILSSYRRQKNVDKLVKAVSDPESLAKETKGDTSAPRIRALALSRLLQVGNKKSLRAFKKYLQPQTDPNLTLTALSALEANLAKNYTPPKSLKESVRRLVFKTPYKPVRTKASRVFEKMEDNKPKKVK